MKKLTAAFTAFCFLITSSVLASPSSQSTPPLKSNSAAQLDLPNHIGSVESFFEGSLGKTIVYIQDAHNSLEAQEHIAKLIHFLVKTRGVKTVFEEGYEGPVPTDEFFGFIQDKKIREQVSHFILDRLRIGGAEYAHINRDEDFKLIGADSFALHGENIAAYRRTAGRRDETKKDLDSLAAGIEKLANRYFSKELKSWLKTRARFDQKRLSLLDYLKRTHETSLKAFSVRPPNPSFRRKPESRLDSPVRPGNDRIGDAPERLPAEEKWNTGYPSLSILLAAERSKDQTILEEAKRLDAKTVFGEIERLEAALSEKFLMEERDRLIFHYLRGIHLLKRLNDIEVTPAEYEEVKSKLLDLDTQAAADLIAKHTKRTVVLSKKWRENIESAVQFYELSKARDAYLERSVDEFIKGSEQTAVLVYGGFHKDPITELLKKKGLSYYVVSPKITQPDPVHEDYYKRLMSAGYLPNELLIPISRASRTVSYYAAADNRALPEEVRSQARAELRGYIQRLAESVASGKRKAANAVGTTALLTALITGDGSFAAPNPSQAEPPLAHHSVQTGKVEAPLFAAQFFPPGTSLPTPLISLDTPEGPVEILTGAQRGNPFVVVRKNGVDTSYSLSSPVNLDVFLVAPDNRYIIFNEAFTRLALIPLVEGLEFNRVVIPSAFPVQLASGIFKNRRWLLKMTDGQEFTLVAGETGEMTVTEGIEEPRFNLEFNPIDSNQVLVTDTRDGRVVLEHAYDPTKFGNRPPIDNAALYESESGALAVLIVDLVNGKVDVFRIGIDRAPLTKRPLAGVSVSKVEFEGEDLLKLSVLSSQRRVRTYLIDLNEGKVVKSLTERIPVVKRSRDKTLADVTPLPWLRFQGSIETFEIKKPGSTTEVFEDLENPDVIAVKAARADEGVALRLGTPEAPFNLERFLGASDELVIALKGTHGTYRVELTTVDAFGRETKHHAIVKGVKRGKAAVFTVKLSDFAPHLTETELEEVFFLALINIAPQRSKFEITAAPRSEARSSRKAYSDLERNIEHAWHQLLSEPTPKNLGLLIRAYRLNVPQEEQKEKGGIGKQRGFGHARGQALRLRDSWKASHLWGQVPNRAGLLLGYFPALLFGFFLERYSREAKERTQPDNHLRPFPTQSKVSFSRPSFFHKKRIVPIDQSQAPRSEARNAGANIGDIPKVLARMIKLYLEEKNPYHHVIVQMKGPEGSPYTLDFMLHEAIEDMWIQDIEEALKKISVVQEKAEQWRITVVLASYEFALAESKEEAMKAMKAPMSSIIQFEFEPAIPSKAPLPLTQKDYERIHREVVNETVSKYGLFGPGKSAIELYVAQKINPSEIDIGQIIEYLITGNPARTKEKAQEILKRSDQVLAAKLEGRAEARNEETESEVEKKAGELAQRLELEKTPLKTILVVDDDQALRNTLTEFLQWKAGFKGTIITAADGLEAFGLLETEKPGLVITDRTMPKMDGKALVRKIRNEKGGFPPVIVFSGESDSIIDALRAELKVDDLNLVELTKSIDERVLAEIVRILASRSEVRSWEEKELKRELVRSIALKSGFGKEVTASELETLRGLVEESERGEKILSNAWDVRIDHFLDVLGFSEAERSYGLESALVNLGSRIKQLPIRSEVREKKQSAGRRPQVAGNRRKINERVSGVDVDPTAVPRLPTRSSRSLGAQATQSFEYQPFSVPPFVAEAQKPSRITETVAAMINALGTTGIWAKKALAKPEANATVANRSHNVAMYFRPLLFSIAGTVAGFVRRVNEATTNLATTNQFGNNPMAAGTKQEEGNLNVKVGSSTLGVGSEVLRTPQSEFRIGETRSEARNEKAEGRGPKAEEKNPFLSPSPFSLQPSFLRSEARNEKVEALVEKLIKGSKLEHAPLGTILVADDKAEIRNAIVELLK